jgi:hypothetical protein
VLYSWLEASTKVSKSFLTKRTCLTSTDNNSSHSMTCFIPEQTMSFTSSRAISMSSGVWLIELSKMEVDLTFSL